MLAASLPADCPASAMRESPPRSTRKSASRKEVADLSFEQTRFFSRYAYRAALEEITRQRVPLDWAQTTGNLGVTFMSLAQRKRDPAMARTAVVQIEVARDALTAVGDFRAGHFEEQLTMARSVAKQVQGH